MKALITTQYKEWYGCEDNVGVEGHGRYKNKGGSDFVIDLPEYTLMYREDDIRKAFNEEYNTEGSFTLFEIIDIEPCYREPQPIKLILSGVVDM